MPVIPAIFGIMGATHRSAEAMLQPSLGADDHRERMTAMRSIRIPLRSRKYPGLFAIIDEADADLVCEFVWHPTYSDGKWYASSRDPATRKHIYLHRLITNAPRRKKVDHANNDGLDNRRGNLRVCTNAQNMWNRQGPQRNNRSGYLGVYRKCNRWNACVCVNGRKTYLRGFATAEDAARARDVLAKKLHGRFATLNFPDEPEDGNAVLPLGLESA